MYKEKSLRDMDFEEIVIKYEKLFIGIIGKKEFDELINNYRKIYQTFIRYKSEGYDSPSAMGRDKIAYGRNIIYGWLIEEIIIEILRKNRNLKSVKLFGNDKMHDFQYNHVLKKIEIIGSKSTDPDIEIITNNNESFLIELKTGNKNIFTVKKGNVESLFSSVANYNKFCFILMIDLVNGLFQFKDLNYFETQIPFSNANMEGQICYNFPQPDTKIEKLININFDDYKDVSVFENVWVKKFKLLKFSIENNLKDWKKVIKTKIEIEKLEEEKELSLNEFHKKINLKVSKNPKTKMSWEEIEKELKY